MSQTAIEIGNRSDGLLEHLAAKDASVDACYQCLRCSAGCPMLSFMDLAPNRVIRLVQFGQDEAVLSSETIWMCASCQTCTTRCPNNVEIAHMMDVLRQEAMRQKVPCPIPEVEKFHRAFVKSIRRGRIHELSLIARYKITTGKFTDDMKIGMEMFKRGRIKLLPRKVADSYEVKSLFKLAGKGE